MEQPRSYKRQNYKWKYWQPPKTAILKVGQDMSWKTCNNAHGLQTAAPIATKSWSDS